MNRKLTFAAALILSLAAFHVDAARASGFTVHACDVFTHAKGHATQADTHESYFFSPDFENKVLMTGYVMDRSMLTLRMTTSGELAGEALDEQTGTRTRVSGPARATRFETARFKVNVECGGSIEVPYALRSTEGFVYVPGFERQNFNIHTDRSIATFRHCYLGDAQSTARDLGHRFHLPTEVKPDGQVAWTYQEVQWSDSECPPEWDRCRYFGTPTYIPHEGSIEACR